MPRDPREDGCTCSWTTYDETYHELHEPGCPVTLPPRRHQHSHPSPSLAVGAWCNGSPEDHSCGQFRPVYDFPKETWDPYFAVYMVDGRVPRPHPVEGQPYDPAYGIITVEEWRQVCKRIKENTLFDG